MKTREFLIAARGVDCVIRYRMVRRGDNYYEAASDEGIVDMNSDLSTLKSELDKMGKTYIDEGDYLE